MRLEGWQLIRVIGRTCPWKAFGGEMLHLQPPQPRPTSQWRTHERRQNIYLTYAPTAPRDKTHEHIMRACQHADERRRRGGSEPTRHRAERGGLPTRAPPVLCESFCFQRARGSRSLRRRLQRNGIASSSRAVQAQKPFVKAQRNHPTTPTTSATPSEHLSP